MKIAYFDCFGGAAGDMTVASMLDAGVTMADLKRGLSKLGLDNEFTLESHKVTRCGLAGTWLDVQLAGHHEHPHEHPHEHAHEHPHKHPHRHDHDHDHDHHHGGHGHSHDSDHKHDHDHGHKHDHGHSHDDAGGHVHGRNLPDIFELLDKAKYPQRVDDRIRKIFRRLAHAEAAAHGVDISEVHFHEVGAVDSIVDIVATVIALELLDIDRIYCSAIPLGNGTVKCAHGLIPIPAPATAELMKDGAIAESSVMMELCTPTGAAIMTTLAEEFTTLPAMDISAIGYGAGTRELPDRPNMMRVFIGDPIGVRTGDTVLQLQANIDDCSGELVASALDRLMQNGALDAWITPVTMKKSRPAMILSALCEPVDADRLERIFFTETTTIGVRRTTCRRTCLKRESVTVTTEFGDLRMKRSELDGETVTARPEFDDCKVAAEAHRVPVRQVMEAALNAWRKTIS